jgi:hypothetical protein
VVMVAPIPEVPQPVHVAPQRPSLARPLNCSLERETFRLHFRDKNRHDVGESQSNKAA